MQKTIGYVVTGMMPGGFDTYYDTATNGGDYRAYFGTVSGTGSVLDGKKVLIHNRAKGGSVWGVNPVARAEAIARMTVDGTCVLSAGIYKCPNTTTAVPDGGVSDVEPAMFIGINVAAGDSELTDEERSHLTVNSQVGVLFHTIATNNMNVNLNKRQVNAMLTGLYTDWSSIPTAGAGPITVCRRVDGSGTQASFNAYYQGVNCSSTAVPPADANASVPGGYTVVMNSTSSDVKTCMNNAFNAGKMAIGNLSAESVPGGTDKWHAVNLGGVTPSKTTATSGEWDFVMEQTLQWRNQTVNAVPVPNANVQPFLDTYLARSGDPAYVGTLVGIMALPTLYDATLPANLNKVMKGTREGNSCNNHQMYY